MPMTLKLLSIILLFAIATNSYSAKNTFPEYDNIYVNDYANLLDNNSEKRIRNNLKELYQHRKIQMTVLTISSVKEYIPESSIESFATRLFNDWGIGDTESNNGVLILIARRDREMRIEIGSGYAKSWDSTMKKVIEKTFIPNFKKNNYQSGIEKGVEETIYKVAGNYPSEYQLGDFALFWKNIQRITGNWIWGAYSLFLIPLAWLVKIIRRYFRHKPKDCPICQNKLVLLDEIMDDEHLDGGQRLEEYLNSVDYDVWQCHSCSHMQIDAYKTWFSKISACSSCDYKTLVTKTIILEHATTSSSGRKRIDYNCENCGYDDSEFRTLSRKLETSSSSFGGGNSSGGGASGSW